MSGQALACIVQGCGGIELGVVHGEQRIFKCIDEGVDPVQDAFFRSDNGSSDGPMKEFDRVGDGFGLGVFRDDTVALVILERNPNTPSFIAAKVPRVPC